MGWSIACLKNELTFDENCRDAIHNLNVVTWGEDYDVGYEGYLFTEEFEGKTSTKYNLYFDCDHMEHMDFLWNKDLQQVLSEHKVTGTVCFGSLEGDNAGSFW